MSVLWSMPFTATVSAQLLNELIIIVLSKTSHAGIHVTIYLKGGARLFPAAAKEWDSFSVTFALKGLFQTTSGAWVYFVQTPRDDIRNVRRTAGRILACVASAPLRAEWNRTARKSFFAFASSRLTSRIAPAPFFARPECEKALSRGPISFGS